MTTVKLAQDLLLPVGTVFYGHHGRQWKLGKKIGQGRCCVVHEATLIDEDIKGAVKVYNTGDNFAAACMREAMLIYVLQKEFGRCKYIVQKYDEFMYRDHEVLVEECLGDSLRVIIAKHEDDNMSLWMIQRLALDTFKSLNRLHSQGFIHADVKPANILWCPQDSCMKLTDFGLTFHKDDLEVSPMVQATYYRAPETWDLIEQGIKDLELTIDKKLSDRSETDENGAEDETVDEADSIPSKSASDCSLTAEQTGLTGAIDVWSSGQMLLEMFRGKKTPTTSAKSGMCKNCQDLQSNQLCIYSAAAMQCIYERECDHFPGIESALCDFKDLLMSMLCCRRENRINLTAVIEHKFFQHSLDATYLDFIILPTRVLRLLNLFDNKDIEDENEKTDIIEDIKSECQKFGHVEECVLDIGPNSPGKVYVLYPDAQCAIRAVKKLNGRIFNDRTVISTFFPLDSFINKKWY